MLAHLMQFMDVLLCLEAVHTLKPHSPFSAAVTNISYPGRGQMACLDQWIVLDSSYLVFFPLGEL